MKNNRIKILVLMIFLLMTTGCGNKKYIIDDEKKIVKYEETDQMLQKDILCLPDSNGKLYEVYEKYNDQLKIPFDELPKCTDFKVNSNASTGLWEGLFVKPLAYLILALGRVVNNLGLSLIIIGLLIRLILLPFTIKSSRQTYNMRKAQPELEKLERKYRNRNDNDALMAKSQEMMLIYKKYKVNPMLGCLLAFIQLPVFIAFLHAIYRVPAIYEESLLGFNLGMSPLKGITSGNYLYILLLVLIAASTYFSFKQTLKQTPQTTPEAESQMKIMIYVMLIVIIYGSFSLPTALAFYWIITYAFIAVQNILLNYINEKTIGADKKGNKKNKKEKIKKRLEKKEGMKYGKDN